MMRTVLVVFFASVKGWAADPIVVSAASPIVGVTADSLASIFGSQLATVTATANGLPWPTQLGDISVVYVLDSASKTQMASLLYVSPTQMNIWIPPGVATGPASIQFPSTGLPPGVGTAVLRSVPVTIQNVAPSLFSADGSGTGVAGASAVRVIIPSTIQAPVAVFSCNAQGCVAIPINLGIDTPVYLSLYGTGIRGGSGLDPVVVTIGGTQVKPIYSGPEGQIPGLDQVNVPVPLTLRGSGLVNVTVTVDGVSSNAVQIALQ